MTPAVIAGTPAPMMPVRKEMTVQDLWGILSRRRGIVLGVLLLTIVVAGNPVRDVHSSLQRVGGDPGAKGIG